MAFNTLPNTLLVEGSVDWLFDDKYNLKTTFNHKDITVFFADMKTFFSIIKTIIKPSNSLAMAGTLQQGLLQTDFSLHVFVGNKKVLQMGIGSEQNWYNQLLGLMGFLQ
jgi:hypothetical protein